MICFAPSSPESHNVTVLLYHLVFQAKYRRVVFDAQVDQVVKEVCEDIEKRYQIKFLEIGTRSKVRSRVERIFGAQSNLRKKAIRSIGLLCLENGQRVDKSILIAKSPLFSPKMQRIYSPTLTI